MSKHKLLLADDSITIQKVVNLTFADEGIEVITVGDGNSAMEKFAEITPDLVMADINMPGLNGYEICERIRGNEATRHIPVILLVGSFEPFDEEEARRVGANDFLTKPFQSIRQLVTKVSGLLDSAVGSEKSSTDEVISDLETSEAKAMPGEFEDTLKMRKAESAAEDLGDAGMDDEMIQTNQVGGLGLDETPKFESKSEAEGEKDFAKTQPLSTAELDEINSYQSSEQSDMQEQSPAAAEQISVADERGYAFVGDAPLSVPTPIAEEEISPMEQAETPAYENQYAPQSEAFYQPEEAEISPTAEADSALELEDDGNLLELPPQESLSAAALSQSVWQEDITPIDESFEPSKEAQEAETSELNQFATDETADENQFESSEETPEAVTVEATAEVEPSESVVAEAVADETSDENQFESNIVGQEAVTAEMIDANQTESSDAEKAETTSETAEIKSLSPEVIEAIAAKISERFSDKVIREIVAEITPQITELIAKRIAEENSRE